jgi:hypothetical protein
MTLWYIRVYPKKQNIDYQKEELSKFGVDPL